MFSIMGKVIIPKATALYDSKPERKGHARLRAHHHSFIIILVLSTLHSEPPRFSSSRDERGNLTRFLCASRSTKTIVVTRAQRARQAPAAPGNMNQGQQPPPAPQAQQQAPPASGSTSHRSGTATAGSASASSTSSFRFGTGTLPYRPGLRRPQHRGYGNETLQQSHCAPRRKIRWGGGQLGRVPGQCARQGTTVQLASPNHGANR